jgi:hypothetical protein
MADREELEEFESLASAFDRVILMLLGLSVLADSDEVNAAIGDSNASGWYVDSVDVSAVSRACDLSATPVKRWFVIFGTFTMTGDLEEDRMYTPDTLSGSFTIKLHADGTVELESVTAELEWPEDEDEGEPDFADDFDDEPDLDIESDLRDEV